MIPDEYPRFKAPFITKDQIQTSVTNFREKYCKENILQIDIEKIIELDLRIRIIPIKNLLNDKNIDAFISRDFKTIIIDNDIYMNDNRVYRRRFSLGHELGHLVLHKNIYENISFESADEWIEFIEKITRLNIPTLNIMHMNSAVNY